MSIILLTTSTACSGDKESKIPQSMTVYNINLSRAQNKRLDEALNGWNRRFNLHYFTKVSSGGYLGVQQTSDKEILGEDIIGCYYRDGNKKIIYIKEGFPYTHALTTLFYHELGHAMGLRHNPDIYSIMNPKSDSSICSVPNWDDTYSLLCELGLSFTQIPNKNDKIWTTDRQVHTRRSTY